MRVLIAVLMFAFGVAACDDNVVGGGAGALPQRDAMPGNPDPDMALPPLPDATVPEPDAEIDAAPAPKMNRLEIDGAAAIEVVVRETVTLRVIYTDTFGEPIADGDVRIMAQAGSGLVFDANTKRTNPLGRAEFDLTAGELLGDFQVTATADFVVAPVTWDVRVVQPAPGSVAVTVNYGGRYDPEIFGRVQVRLVEGGCVGALDNNPGGGLRDVIEGMDLQPFESGDISLIEGVPAGFEFSAVAFARNANNRALAYGCTEGNTAVSGEQVPVIVPLQDGRLEFKGIFEVDHVLDLSLLLENGDNEGLRNFVTILEVLGALGGARGEGANFRGDAVLLLVCDRLDVPGFLEPFICDDNIIFALVREGVAAAIHDMIENALPPDALRGLNVIGDVASIFQEMHVNGQIEFIESFPNDDNILPLNENRWYGLDFVWREGCPFDEPDRCRRNFDLVERVDGRDAPIRGEFDAEIIEEGVMEIAPHTMSLDYGLLMLAVLQGWILPEVLGQPGPVRLVDFVIGLIDCPSVNAGLPPDIMAPLRDNFCETVIAAPMAEFLRDQLLGIEGGLQSLTIAGTVNYADDYPNLRVDRLFDGEWAGAFGEGPMLFPEFGTFSGCRDTECAQLEMMDEAVQP